MAGEATSADCNIEMDQPYMAGSTQTSNIELNILDF